MNPVLPGQADNHTTKDNIMKTREQRDQFGWLPLGDASRRHLALTLTTFRNALAYRLSRHVAGRILLHALCMLGDAKPSWHWAAIRRQVACRNNCRAAMGPRG